MMALPEITPPAGTPIFLLSGHAVQSRTLYADVPYRTGQARRRRTCTTAPRAVTVGWLLTSEEMQEVDAWYEDVLLAGEREFSAQVKGIGSPAGGLLWFRARWIAPYECESLHFGRWRVTGSLLLTGDGQEADPYTPEMAGELRLDLRGAARLLERRALLSPRLSVSLVKRA
jgi:hypothetical protein